MSAHVMIGATANVCVPNCNTTLTQTTLTDSCKHSTNQHHRKDESSQLAYTTQTDITETKLKIVSQIQNYASIHTERVSWVG